MRGRNLEPLPRHRAARGTAAPRAEVPPAAFDEDNARTLEARAFDHAPRTVESHDFDHEPSFDSASTTRAPVVTDNSRTDQMELFDPDELTNVDKLS